MSHKKSLAPQSEAGRRHVVVELLILIRVFKFLTICLAGMSLGNLHENSDGGE